MERFISKKLIQWRHESRRLPLLLRGARQVGKTYVIDQFGQTEFTSYLKINFEMQAKFKICFKELDPTIILNNIELLSGQRIEPGKTLLFLDEIQECPRAIMALRYFKENMPELHVIGAGSLLEFALEDEQFRMPVGRVQFIYLKPLSFDEYLKNHPQFSHLYAFCQTVNLRTPIAAPVHQQLLQLVKEYSIIGGMPAVVKEFFTSHSFQKSQDYQGVLLSTYQSDFGKYASKSQHKYLQILFNKAPGLIGQQIKYVKISPDHRSRDLKQAFYDLEKAGLVYPIYATTAAGIPLNALTNEKKYKLAFLDIGLVNKVSELSAETLQQNDLLLINQGALAEQFVGQELLAYHNVLDAPHLYFWVREAHNSMAEIDYITTVDGNIVVPIEVKAGHLGRLKSLQIFLKEKNLAIGVRLSQHPLATNNGILSIPLYLISALARLYRHYQQDISTSS